MRTHINSGVRRITPGAIRGHAYRSESTIDRKSLIKAAREASQALNLRSTVRMVLGEIVSCYGAQQIDRGLMVWPSNKYLAQKTGLVERTIRFALRDLIEAELIEPCDSANRKRFAIRSEDGVIIDAYGFNLMPLYVRRLEFEQTLTHMRIEEKIRRQHFDEITICRKALEEMLRDIANPTLENAFRALLTDTPDRHSKLMLENVLARYRALKTAVEQVYLEKVDSGRPGVSFPHIESNKNISVENCQKAAETPEPTKTVLQTEQVPLALIVEACPTLSTYDRHVTSVGELIETSRRLRSSIGAHIDAWNEAVGKLGEPITAILVAYVLQVHEDDQNSGKRLIKNPGGMFRSLARRFEAGEFDLKQELIALRRRHMA